MPVGGKERLRQDRIEGYGRLITQWVIEKVTREKAEKAVQQPAAQQQEGTKGDTSQK